MSPGAWIAIAVLLAVLSWLRPTSVWIGRAARALATVAGTGPRAVAAIGLVSLVASSAMLCWIGPPLPYIHDEHANLLGADTFASGRLTNPTHPLWQHFETFHVLQRPSYMSKYPPGEALVLALGQVLTGVPIVGVVASTVLGAAAVCWMLLAWVPRRWALVGGLCAAIHPLVLHWAWCYWGGNVALLGGALVLGAVGRMRRRPCSARDTAVMMVGVWLLSVSRPFEGALLAAPLVVAAAVYALCEPSRGRALRAFWLPLAAGVAFIALTTGYYDYRVTGSAFTMPYQVHDRTYAVAPPFVWQPPRSGIAYRDPVFREYYLGRELSQYELHHTLPGAFVAVGRKVLGLLVAYCSPFTLVAPLLLSVGWMLRRRAGRWKVLLGLGLFGVGLTSLWSFAHYFAPACGLFFLGVASGARRLAAFRPRGLAIGRALARATVLTSVAALGVEYVEYASAPRPAMHMRTPLDRAKVVSALAALGGKHVVLVRYGEHHTSHNEWVYNAADIDASGVVWARELSAPENARLLKYFRDRRAWLVRVDEELVDVVRYPEDGTPPLLAGF